MKTCTTTFCALFIFDKAQKKTPFNFFWDIINSFCNSTEIQWKISKTLKKKKIIRKGLNKFSSNSYNWFTLDFTKGPSCKQFQASCFELHINTITVFIPA